MLPLKGSTWGFYTIAFFLRKGTRPRWRECSGESDPQPLAGFRGSNRPSPRRAFFSDLSAGRTTPVRHTPGVRARFRVCSTAEPPTLRPRGTPRMRSAAVPGSARWALRAFVFGPRQRGFTRAPRPVASRAGSGGARAGGVGWAADREAWQLRPIWNRRAKVERGLWGLYP